MQTRAGRFNIRLTIVRWTQTLDFDFSVSALMFVQSTICRSIELTWVQQTPLRFEFLWGGYFYWVKGFILFFSQCLSGLISYYIGTLFCPIGKVNWSNICKQIQVWFLEIHLSEKKSRGKVMYGWECLCNLDFKAKAVHGWATDLIRVIHAYRERPWKKQHVC